MTQTTQIKLNFLPMQQRISGVFGMDAKVQGPKDVASRLHSAGRVTVGGGGGVRKQEEDVRRVKVQEKERGCFCGCRDNSLCLAAAWGTRATNVTQTKTRGTSVHRRAHAAVEQESDSGVLQKEGYEHTMLLHAHSHAQWKQTDCGWYHLQ